MTGVIVPERHSRYHFDEWDSIVVEGVSLFMPKRSRTGWVFRRFDDPKIAVPLTFAELNAASEHPDYEFHAGHHHPAQVAARADAGASSLIELAQHETQKVLWRLEWVTRFMRLQHAGLVTRSDEGFKLAIRLIEPEMAKLEWDLSPPSKSRLKLKKTRNSRRQVLSRTAKPKPATRAGAAEDVRRRKTPSARTLQRYYLAFVQGGYVPLALRDGRWNSGNREPRIVGRALELLVIEARRYATPEKPTYEVCHGRLSAVIDGENLGKAAADQIACPSINAIRRYVKALGGFYVDVGRLGIKAAQLKWNIVSTGPGATRLLQRIEMDHWTIDLRSFCIVVGIWHRLRKDLKKKLRRMSICIAIDVASRVILGAHISENPSSDDAVEVLRQVCSDKGEYADAVGALSSWHQRGSLGLLGVDAGSAFLNERVRLVVACLGGTFELPAIDRSFLRGTVERVLKTMHLRLIARFPGRTFENSVARGEYAPDDHAVFDLEDLSYVITRWIVDEYHNTPHEGLDFRTPSNTWKELDEKYGVIPPPYRAKMRAIFGVKLVGTLGNNGLRVLGLRYWSDVLIQHFLYHGPVELELSVDPQDLGRISVRIDKTWHVAVCMAAGFDDISVRTWIASVEDLRRRFAAEAKLSEPIVHASNRAIEERTREARKRYGIAEVSITAAEFARYEEDLFAGFSYPGDATIPTTLPVDPLEGGFPATGSAPPSGTPADPTGDDPEGDDFRFES